MEEDKVTDELINKTEKLWNVLIECTANKEGKSDSSEVAIIMSILVASVVCEVCKTNPISSYYYTNYIMSRTHRLIKKQLKLDEKDAEKEQGFSSINLFS